jgi:hypothetical protein
VAKPRTVSSSPWLVSQDLLCFGNPLVEQVSGMLRLRRARHHWQGGDARALWVGLFAVWAETFTTENHGEPVFFDVPDLDLNPRKAIAFSLSTNEQLLQ